MLNLTIKEEKILFNNDLTEYTDSREGQAVKRAFSTGNEKEIKKALEIYYTARENKTFTYNSKLDRIKAIELDRMFASYLADIN